MLVYKKNSKNMCDSLYALAAPCDLHVTRCYLCISTPDKQRSIYGLYNINRYMMIY